MENLKIINEKENALFNRKEITVILEEKTTPSRDHVKKMISEKFSTNEENIKIKKILGKFGSKNFKINASIYKSKEDMNNTEPKSKQIPKLTKESEASNQASA